MADDRRIAIDPEIAYGRPVIRVRESHSLEAQAIKYLDIETMRHLGIDVVFLNEATTSSSGRSSGLRLAAHHVRC